MTNKRRSQNFPKPKLFLVALWIFANLIGVSVATLVVFFLYSTLEINRYSYSQDWLRVIKGIAICGATQGLIIATVQSVVLFIAKIPVIKWWLASIVGMTLGMMLPILYGIAIHNSTDRYIIIAWIFSWILPAILCVLATFKGKKNRLRGVVINSIAYLSWGISLIIGLLFLGAYLDKPEIKTLIIGICSMLSIFAIGAWLSGYIFLSLYNQQRRIKKININEFLK